MPEWQAVILLTLAAGITMPVGAALASVERVRPAWLENELRHAVIAFGGGALLAAVALVLVPEGLKSLSWLPACAAFATGALMFMALDIVLARRGTPASQLVAMLSDFLPEALALGATAAMQGAAGPLLALIIALQNLPEGFNAFRELRSATRYRPRAIVAAFLAMAMLGPAFGLFGFWVLVGHHALVAAIMLFAAGGILYLMFQDIAPQAHLENHWAPPLGAIFGFLLGMLGKVFVDA